MNGLHARGLSVRASGARVSKHRLAMFSRETGEVLCEFNATQPRPWHKKASAKRKRKVAKQTRKANR